MMPNWRTVCGSNAARSVVVLVAVIGAQWNVHAQHAPATAPAAANPVSATTAARFVEDCNEAMERGVATLGCQAPLYRNELERLKREAVSTQNPQLLSFVGDAYRNPRSGLGDMGQAYRWYLMAAVRGDPLAMQRLSEMNRKGIGVPKDNVKALGYARLVQRMSQPGGAAQPNVVSMINELGDEMAVEEVALAERFAGQLQERIRREGSLDGAADAGGTTGTGSLTVTPERGLPGVPQPPTSRASGTVAPVPGSILPGVPAQRVP